MSEAIELVKQERLRQIEAEGWTPQHDDQHSQGEMAMAAACYAAPVPIRAEMEVSCGCRGLAECAHIFGKSEWLNPWPWDEKWWKPSDPIRNLVKAAALLVAEIERLQRLNGAPNEP